MGGTACRRQEVESSIGLLDWWAAPKVRHGGVRVDTLKPKEGMLSKIGQMLGNMR